MDVDNDCHLTAQNSAGILDRMDYAEAGENPCDVELLVDDQIYPVHRNVLAAASIYFEAMFKGPFIESSQREIRLHDLNPSIVESLVQFAYTGRVDAAEGSTEELLAAAVRFQFPDLERRCCALLASCLHPSNCLGTVELAEQFACSTLKDTADLYSRRHFEGIVGYEELKMLSVEDFVRLLSHDDLTVTAEADCVQAVLLWLGCDLTNRLQYADAAFRTIRMDLVTATEMVHFIRQLARIEGENGPLGAALTQAYMSSIGSGNPINRPRNSTKRFVYIAGGMVSEGVDPTMERYDPDTDCWISFSGGNDCTWNLVGGVRDNRLVTFPSMPDTEQQCHVELYDPVLNVWTKESVVGKFSVPEDCAVVPHGTSLFFIGGTAKSHSETEASAKLVVFDKSRTWRPLASMQKARVSPGAVIGFDGLLYVAGGYGWVQDDGEVVAAEKSMERYNVATDTWESMPSMSRARSSFGLIELNGCLYAIGGRGKKTTTNSCEKYDPVAQSWTDIAKLRTRRNGHVVFAAHGYIFACGGLDGSEYLNTMEAYDPHRNVWFPRASMRTERWNAVVGIMEASLFPPGCDNEKSKKTARRLSA